MYTNYEKQYYANWRNTINFYVTRHVNATISHELWYDHNRPKDRDWNRFEFHQDLSLGLNYRFATF